MTTGFRLSGRARSRSSRVIWIAFTLAHLMWTVDQHQVSTSAQQGAARSTAAAPGALVPLRLLDPVEPRRVPPHDEIPLARRHVGELLGDRLTRARPGRVAVRVVARPEDVLQARLVAQLHPRMVLDEGRVSLPVPVRARRLGDDRLGPEAVFLEGRVHAL